MRIAFGLESLRGLRTGVGLYTQHLLGELIKSAGEDELAGFAGRVVFGKRDLGRLLDEGLRGVERGTAGRGLAWLAAARAMPAAYVARQALREMLVSRTMRSLAAKGFIYHEPNYVPVRYRGPMVVTVHDLSHIRHPEYHPKGRVDFLMRFLPAAIARADRILTVSAFSAQEICDVFGVSADKISVTPLGADEGFRLRAKAEVANTLGEFRLRYRGYILSVATLEPRKNIGRLVAAYALLPKHLREEFPLVLVGGQGWRDASLHECIDKADGVIRLGYLPRLKLFQLYSAAAAFAYPTLYEGFGLPVLEAFSSGTPVLTSRGGAVGELAGGAACEVDPFSVEEIAVGLRNVLENEGAARRLLELGLLRATEFSWQKCAEHTRTAYGRVL